MTSKPERISNIREERQRNGIGSIPDDILVSLVFVRLSARYVLVVRLVCKSWYSLTKSPCFILSHVRRARTNILFKSKVMSTLYRVSLLAKGTARRTIVERETLDLTSKLMEYVGGKYKLELLASCDGLLCFNFEGHRNSRIGYIVCNPVTKDFLNVPRRNLLNGGDDFFINIIAFYFHSSTGEYRLLGQYFERGRYEIAVRNIGYEVFTIGGSHRAWRPINASSGISSSWLWRSHISVHESVHFLYYMYQCIVAFDTNTEKFKTISISGVHRHGYLNDNRFNLIEMGESLGLCQTYPNNQMDIWCLKDYTKEEWVKQYTLPLWEIRIFRMCDALAIWEDEKELLLQFDHRFFVLYNLKSKTFKKKVHRFWPFPRTYVTHIESLVSCNSLSSRVS